VRGRGRKTQRLPARVDQLSEKRFGRIEATSTGPGVVDLGLPLRANARRQTITRRALLIAVVLGIVVALEILRPVHAVNPAARAAIETAITLIAMLTAGLLIASFKRDHQTAGLILLCTLAAASLVDFVYYAAPTVVGVRTLQYGDGAWVGWELIVGFTLAAVALAPTTSTVDSRPGPAKFAVLVIASAAVLAGLLAQVIAVSTDTAGAGAATVGVADHPLALGIHMASAAILGFAALAFLAGHRPAQSGSRLLAGASLLLAATNLQYLATPAAATDWVTPREGLRLGAYALLLGAAYVRYARLRRQETYAAICSERERIARDLHDGLAQDLACIAVQGQRLECGLGPEHPLMLAVRQAAAATRGVIADLTASTAPNTEAALRVIADELGHRFDLQVNVRIETDTALGANSELEPGQREDLIRIAREAIVNAALHGTARHVDVVLLRRGTTLLMRVSDDGRGIADGQESGFGLRTMRARAESLGGQLYAHPRAGGGTELELLVS
jgi:signal transduction histidine kinase